jgi:hypothetical protein
MNRSIALIGVFVIAFGFALVAYPIALTGTEQLDLEQEVGFLLAPVGLVVVMLGALALNPERTTVGGTFGNPEADLDRTARGRSLEPRPARPFHPYEPVDCRYCRTVITADLAQCPRCARPRECRSCGRPLAMVEDRVTCPACKRTEALCNCPHLARPGASPTANVSIPRRR